ncbi:peptide chain release factor RF-1 [Plesiocystis pacifica SIR-1]|uniref:Peptide chain release factor RF-1 n=1 Tax=Plesiocystis pacifica SIR-1 TaxID=391625 RepID=A6G5H9_9BACT|nr:PCRF domain-containing protein [Plesiocystis pacifica]EDM78922.1 peptide chain release factor RF-1 [Plesiocystis pacifica SIR-1]
MNPRLRAKIENIAERHEELGEMICDQEVMADKRRFLELSREHAELTPVAMAFAKLVELERQLGETRELLDDPDMRELAQADVRELGGQVEDAETELTRLLTPKDPNDAKNVILEIRAGTGGDEAGLFVADLWRMYNRFSERHRWAIDQVEFSENSAGGFKEITGRVQGKGAWAQLKFERGVHRVQRVPATESQGRIHTSTATVAIMPEPRTSTSTSIPRTSSSRPCARAARAGSTSTPRLRGPPAPQAHGHRVRCDQRSPAQNASSHEALRSRCSDQIQSKQRRRPWSDRREAQKSTTIIRRTASPTTASR